MSAPIDDGGAAFPVSETNGCGTLILTSAGMSLRDYFAATAMQGFCSDRPIPSERGELDYMAMRAYAVADAMLKARTA